MKKLSYLLMFISLIMLYFAYNNYSKTKYFISKSTQVDGIVVNFIIKESYDSEEEEYYDVYYPYIEFTEQESNHKVEFEGSSGDSFKPGYEIGQKIKVRYLKVKDAYHAKIDSFFTLWLGTIIFVIIAILSV